MADATGAEFCRIAVRPDWHDSSDLLGYTNLNNEFVPGRLLEICYDAAQNSNRQYFVLLDEMNIAHVEYYLAEVLSHMEEFSERDGRLQSDSLMPSVPRLSSSAEDIKWHEVALPTNLCLVGSVNMDETTYGFSPKVLDRSFVVDFSSVSLLREPHHDTSVTEATGDVAWWTPAALRGQLQSDDSDHQKLLKRVGEQLQILNGYLPRHMHVGYRVRDEIALFVSVSQEYRDCYVAGASEDINQIDPLDVAIAMKVLPRIHGSQSAIGKCIDDLLQWADPQSDIIDSDETLQLFPFCADRIRRMQDQIISTGYASFWM